MKTILSLLLCLSAPQSALGQCGDFSFANYYGDSMVLQMAPASPVLWGYAGSVGDLVSVTFDGIAYETNAFEGPNAVVTWQLSLDPTTAPGPYIITATSQGCEITLSDVLVGDVWICSGQSNMVHPLSVLDDPGPDIADVVNYPNVRTFMTAVTYFNEPQYDTGAVQHWGLPEPHRTKVFSAICWLVGRNLNIKYNRPIGLIQSSRGASRIEAWSSPDALEKCFPHGVSPGMSEANGASVLWNNMIHPFLRFPIFGILWYQGESNQGNADLYGCAMTAMVDDWRSRWFTDTGGSTDRLFSFGQVQLASNPQKDTVTGFPDVRWYQTYGRGFTPNPEMVRIFTAVACDLPDSHSPDGPIHPRYKRQIAKRLTFGAYQVAYGDESEGRYIGPIPNSFLLVGDTLRISYDAGEALDIRQDGGYEICCAVDMTTFCGTHEWTLAPITNTSETGVVGVSVACAEGEFVTGLRYVWRGSPCPLEKCAVYSTENSLPAGPIIMNQYFPQGKRVHVH